jgi:hypothetical protein
MIQAVCTWGEADDVTVVMKDQQFALYESPSNLDRWKYGMVRAGSTALTFKEAEALGNQLLKASRQARELSKGYAKAMRPKSKRRGIRR